MALIKLCFASLIFWLGCGAVGSFFIFLFDVVKWHMQEKRTVISASAQKLPKIFEGGELNGNNSDTGNNGTSDGYSDNSRSSDGDSDGGSIADSGSEPTERNAPTLFDSWLQP